MKIRTDYVTNSSSSSFVIARKKDYTKNDLREHLMRDKSKLEKFLYNFDDYDLSFDGGVDEIVDLLYANKGLECGDYIITTLESGNDDDFPRCFLYDYEVVCDGENFKISGEYY